MEYDFDFVDLSDDSKVMPVIFSGFEDTGERGHSRAYVHDFLNCTKSGKPYTYILITGPARTGVWWKVVGGGREILGFCPDTLTAEETAVKVVKNQIQNFVNNKGTVIRLRYYNGELVPMERA